MKINGEKVKKVKIMVYKCSYCSDSSILYTKSELKRHLNENHVKCYCGKVINKKKAKDILSYVLCEECKKKQFYLLKK